MITCFENLMLRSFDFAQDRQAQQNGKYLMIAIAPPFAPSIDSGQA